MVDGRRGAFTLIELLCVIAIIALLASLLMPALRGARERAKAAVCMSNLREIYAAFAGYASMFDDKIPPPGTTYATLYGTPGATWWHWLGKGGGFFGQLQVYSGRLQGFTITGTRYPVLRCPGEPGMDDYWPGASRVTVYDNEMAGGSYWMNMSVSWYCYYVGYCPCMNWSNCDPSQYPFRRGFSAGPASGKPAEGWLIMDGPVCQGWADPPCMSWIIDNDVYFPHYAYYSFRHPGERANMLYMDGHVDTAQHISRTGVPLWYALWPYEAGLP